VWVFSRYVGSISHLVLMLKMNGTIPPLPIYLYGMLSDNFTCTTSHCLFQLSTIICTESSDISDLSAHMLFTCSLNVFIFYLFILCSTSVFTGLKC
jgi:hypothetical protein